MLDICLLILTKYHGKTTFEISLPEISPVNRIKKMYQVVLEDLMVEVDAETAANLQEPDYAMRYLQAIRAHLDKEMETTESTSDQENQSTGSSRIFRWNHKAIHLLLDSYKEYESKFESGQSKEGWKLISTTLNERGIKVTPQQCSVKMDSLKRRFKTIKDSQSKTGTSPIFWEYYSVMSELFDKKSWAMPLEGAVSSTLLSKTDVAHSEPKPGCSKSTPQKRKINIEDILNDLKTERQKRDEEKKKRLEEKNRKREESEMKQEQRHREKMELKRELLNVLKK